jgi:hypothetical protein
MLGSAKRAPGIQSAGETGGRRHRRPAARAQRQGGERDHDEPADLVEPTPHIGAPRAHHRRDRRRITRHDQPGERWRLDVERGRHPRAVVRVTHHQQHQQRHPDQHRRRPGIGLAAPDAPRRQRHEGQHHALGPERRRGQQRDHQNGPA